MVGVKETVYKNNSAPIYHGHDKAIRSAGRPFLREWFNRTASTSIRVRRNHLVEP